MTIQPAQAKDRQALESHLESAGLPTSDLPDDLRLFSLAFEQGEIIGSAGIELLGQYGLLRSVAVSEKIRSQGLGRRLLQAALKTAKMEHIRDVYLITDSADRYFERQGFERVERAEAPEAIAGTRQFQGLCAASAIVMRWNPA